MYWTSVHRHACTWFILEYVSTSCDQNCTSHDIENLSTNSYIPCLELVSTRLYLASYTFMHGGWWIQRRKILMRKKRLQAQIWSMQPHNHIYIAMHEFIMKWQHKLKVHIATVEPVYYGHLRINQVSKMSWFSRSMYMIKHHLVSYISVWNFCPCVLGKMFVIE